MARRPITAVLLAALAVATAWTGIATPAAAAPAPAATTTGPACPDNPHVPAVSSYWRTTVVDGVTYDIYQVPNLHPTIPTDGLFFVRCDSE